MARNVTVSITGRDPQITEAGSVGELRTKFNLPSHAATINGSAATDDMELEDYSFVAFAPAVKGAVK